MYAFKTYKEAFKCAQEKADEFGRDMGIETPNAFGEWRVFMLPRLKHRYGFETRCEVVHPLKDPSNA